MSVESHLAATVEARLAALEPWVLERMRETSLPGLSLALVQGGRVVYRRGFGLRDVERGLPATPGTLYGIGSITKSFTCLAVMQLAERGLLDVEDPVERYLPFPLRPVGEPVRLWHLMTHTSGIPALAYAEAAIRHAHGGPGRWLPLGDVEDMLAFLRDAGDWVLARPGERWFYLNEGYVLLGAVIERVSGLPYAEYVRRHILEPLGMERSLFERERLEADPDAAVPYVITREGQHRPGQYLFGRLLADGGLISNVEDLARYALMYLQGGRGPAGPVVGEEAVRAMTAPRVPLPSEDVPELFGGEGAPRPAGYYGYGLHVYPGFLGRTLVGHGGSVLVATGYLGWVPEAGAAVAVLANGSGYPPAQVAACALALLLGEDPERLPFVRVERVLAGLTGTYETYKGTMRAAVRRQGDLLVLEIEGVGGPQPVTLVPLRLDGEPLRFYALAGGRRLVVEFRRRQGGVDLVYERYLLRRVGAL